jgi:malate dehydrogenase (quinone)
MEGRDPNKEVTATRMVTGTDVDYGALTEELLDSLRDKQGFHPLLSSSARSAPGDRWNVRLRDEKTGQHRDVQAKFVFIGAGGGSLPLLHTSGIPDGVRKC